MIVGKHFIADLYGVSADLISFEETVRPIVEDTIEKSNLTRIRSFYKQFSPQGVTGVVLISESHVSLHTWPEYELVNLEVFTCGDFDNAEKAFKLFINKFQPQSYQHHILNRGW